jgi:hypothetical protein
MKNYLGVDIRLDKLMSATTLNPLSLLLLRSRTYSASPMDGALAKRNALSIFIVVA